MCRVREKAVGEVFESTSTITAMAGNVTLRPAQRADIWRLAVIANAANANSALHHRIAPRADEYPWSYYTWRAGLVRHRLADKGTRTIVAEDISTGEVLGFACWAVEGPDTALYKRWFGEGTWPIGWK